MTGKAAEERRLGARHVHLDGPIGPGIPQPVASGREIRSVQRRRARLGLETDHPRAEVRELKSAVEYAAIHSGGSTIAPEDLPPEIFKNPSNEKTQILQALKDSDGNRNAAARLLGISRATLFRRLAALQIEDV